MKKKLKRLLKLRNSSGFTLVEVIVACALLGILIVGVLGFVTPVLSSVREKEKNARAVMLTKAINEYIASSIQYAYYVVVYDTLASGYDIPPGKSKITATYQGDQFPDKKGMGLGTLKTCLDNMPEDTYEVRCIGVQWHLDSTSGERKLMLTNEYVDQTTMEVDFTKSKLVFEECFYNDLYPIIRFNNYTNEYSIGGVPQVTGDDVDIASALEIQTDVYTNMDCYSVNQATRESAGMTYTGKSFVGFNNIKSKLINKGDYNIVPCISGIYDQALYTERVLDDTFRHMLGNEPFVYTDYDGNEFYYPESLVYYLVRKTKTAA